MKCLECGLEAETRETYQGIPVYTCPVGHRTAWIEDSKESKAA